MRYGVADIGLRGQCYPMVLTLTSQRFDLQRTRDPPGQIGLKKEEMNLHLKLVMIKKEKTQLLIARFSSCSLHLVTIPPRVA